MSISIQIRCHPIIIQAVPSVKVSPCCPMCSASARAWRGNIVRKRWENPIHLMSFIGKS